MVTSMTSFISKHGIEYMPWLPRIKAKYHMECQIYELFSNISFIVNIRFPILIAFIFEQVKSNAVVKNIFICLRKILSIRSD